MDTTVMLIKAEIRTIEKTLKGLKTAARASGHHITRQEAQVLSATKGWATQLCMARAEQRGRIHLHNAAAGAELRATLRAPQRGALDHVIRELNRRTAICLPAQGEQQQQSA